MDDRFGIPVLVTGFGPFDSQKVNVSWEIAKILPSLNFESKSIRLVLNEIPVAYSAVNELVPKLWKRHRPQLVVHMGLTRIGSEISLETVAHKDGYVKPDIDNQFPPNGSAYGKDEVLRTVLDAQLVVDTLGNMSEIDVPIKVSTDAGRYVCEFTFYTSLNIDNSRTIFIHVPNTDKGFTIIEMAQVVKEIILLLVDQIMNKSN